MEKITPEEAYNKALIISGSSELRAIACESPEWAYTYALYIDGFPRDDTRKAANLDYEWAYLYAKHLDKATKKVLSSEKIKINGELK